MPQYLIHFDEGNSPGPFNLYLSGSSGETLYATNVSKSQLEAGYVILFNDGIPSSSVVVVNESYGCGNEVNLPFPTITPSITPPSSISPTITPTRSITPTITPTKTPTLTVTPTITPSRTRTVTPTLTVTPSLSIGGTQSPTPTRTITRSPSITPTRTTTPQPCAPREYYISNSGDFYWLACDGTNRYNYFSSGTYICICNATILPGSYNGGAGYLTGGGCDCPY